MRSRFCRTVLIFFASGSLISAQQVRSDTVFEESGMVDLKELAMTENISSAPSNTPFSALAADSIEVIEIELEEEKKSNIYKEIAAVAVVTAFAVYIIVTVFFPGDDSTPEESDGKDIPTLGISIPFTR
ncbi:MAG: hypothetical protein JW746_07795 [Candidatus Krumholzibacteriota bacterium]|nr:hypothetical protein [Candidatus Krumholzibacteriota bacterium]